MTSFAQADDFELFTRIRGQFTLTRLSTGVYDCPADFSEMSYAFTAARLSDRPSATVIRSQPRRRQACYAI